MKAETHTCANCKYSYKANVHKVYVWRCKIITAMFQTKKKLRKLINVWLGRKDEK